MRLIRLKDSDAVRGFLRDVKEDHFPKLDDFEKEFIESVTVRFTQHPMSIKQWNTALKIVNKHHESVELTSIQEVEEGNVRSSYRQQRGRERGR